MNYNMQYNREPEKILPHFHSCLNILLVEDDEDDYLLTREVLADAYHHDEYHLDWVPEAKDALSIILSSHFDILLFDYYLGTKNGIELAKTVYVSHPAPPPIILLTGQGSSDTDVLALEAGIADYIRKQSLNSNILKRSIRYAIARQYAQNALQESKLRINTMINSMCDGVITSDSQGKIDTVNPAGAKLFGYVEHELIGSSIKKLVPSIFSKNYFRKKYIDTHTETEAQHKNGKEFPIELSISEFTLADTPMITCIIHDISNRKEIELQVEHQAHYDSLTDLPNRRLFLDRLDHSLKTACRYNTYCGLLFLDLDNFKHLNDSLGHSIGDNLLIQVANRLLKHVRDSDTVARLGGDEFVVILTDVDKDEQRASTQVHQIADKLREEIGRMYSLAGHDYHFTSSIGIALYPANNDSADDILRHADSAMYYAKSDGRNTTRFYEPSMQTAADIRLQVEKNLRHALNTAEFVLHYQPQVSSQGQLVGLEALIRWQHSTKGLIAPNEFLKVAEEACLMVDIGRWVIKTSISQFSDWRNNKIIPVKTSLAINVSPSQFNDKNFVSLVLDSLHNSQLPAENLLIEITENLMIQNVESTISKMLVLKQKGIRFSIDDFGTGYSSMLYLQKLPISQIKIDKQFVHNFTSDSNNEVIVEAILSLAHHFKLDVVAEGVELTEELDSLQAKGCSSYQGFFFSEPIPAEKLNSTLVQSLFQHLKKTNPNTLY